MRYSQDKISDILIAWYKDKPHDNSPSRRACKQQVLFLVRRTQ